MMKIMGVGAAVVVLAGCGVVQTDATEPSPVDEAAASCARFSSSFSHEPGAISIDGDGGYASDAMSATVCVLGELDTPDIVVSQMESTNSLMGMQTAEANGVVYKWSYHPDNGLDLFIQDATGESQ